MMDERTRAIVLGFIGASVFVLMFYGIFGKTISEEEPKFKVVDRYQGCDVVRYTDPWGAKYHYFLHC